MTVDHRLLDLQALDLTIDRLTRRREALEAEEDLAAARAEADAAESAFGELRLQIDAVDRDNAKLEHEIDSIAKKRAAEEQRMFDGSVANAKELEAMGREVESLKRRTSEREDELLAALEVREGIEARAKEAEAHATELRAKVDRVSAESTTELARVRSELQARVAERASLAGAIAPELLELYEELRAQKKGVGAVALVDGVCQGCHETLSAVELDHVKHADGVPRCEHCRRILVL
jgi:predicted  nucleic acid-binding Zn-ribbon protein